MMASVSAPTWPAVSTPAIPASSGGPARRPPSRRGGRGPRRLPRPGRIRPPVHGHRPPRTGRRRRLPDRRAAGAGRDGRHQGPLREAAWRASTTPSSTTPPRHAPSWTPSKSVDPSLPILGLPGSEVLRLAEAAGLRAVSEAFADRAYNPDGTLTSRSQPGSVLEDPDAVAAPGPADDHRAAISAIDGSDLRISAESRVRPRGFSRRGGHGCRGEAGARRRRHQHQSFV